MLDYKASLNHYTPFTYFRLTGYVRTLLFLVFTPADNQK